MNKIFLNNIKTLKSIRINKLVFLTSVNYFSTVQNKTRIKFTQPLIEDLDKEIKINYPILAFYSLLHAPFYMIAGIANFTHVDVDYIRMGIRSISFIQSLISGINMSIIFKNAETMIIKDINSIDIETIVENERQKIKKLFPLSALPIFISYISSQYLINATILTTQTVTFSFLGFFVSNLLNLWIMKKLIGTSTSFFKTNFIFFILNLFFFYLMLIYLRRNRIKRENDPNRIENLITRTELEEADFQMLEDEIITIYDNLSIDAIKKVEEIYNSDEQN
jgi:hypothetical protein